jgi:putative oxidoreductase
MRTRPLLYDYVALLARIGVGVVVLAHGWQKIQVGITATSANFDAMRVPAPTASAIYATFVELLGGAALILGLALPVAGVLLFVDMAGAFAFVHADNGVFLVDDGSVRNGFELVLVLGVACLLFAAGGAGRFTVDRRLFPRRADAAGRAERTNDHSGTERRDEAAASPVPALEQAPGPTGDKAPRRFPGRNARRAGKAGERAEQTGGEAPDAPRERTDARSAGPGALPEKPEPDTSGTAESAPDQTPSERPRLASSVVEDASRDVLVAGRKRRQSAKKPGDTQPIERTGDDSPG